MEKISLDIDPLTGIRTETGLDEITGRFVVKHQGDISQSVEYAKAIGNDDEVWRDGVKKGFALAGHIPAMTIIELRQIGIDVFTAPLKDIRAGLHKLGKEGFIWKS